MNYLIFDIECCDGQHICEFGYVLFKENFEILKRECITINPEHKFKLTGREHESDMQLAFSEEVYRNSPTYDQVYDKIKSVIQTPDCQIIGFSMMNDAGFLATANELYAKDPIEFSFLDFQTLYQAYTKAPSRISVENMIKELGIENITLHKSDDDSYAVMLALKKICGMESLSLPDTIKKMKKSKGNYMAEKARLHNLSLKEKLSAGNFKAQKEFLSRFLSKLARNENIEHEFSGKAVCIDMGFQRERFNEFLAVIERLYLVGGTYTGKASECDVFIQTHEGEDKRFESAKSAAQEGREIEFLTLGQALDKLSITREDLSKKDYINSSLSKKKARSYQESKPTTLGDLLKSQGVDLEGII